MLFDLWPIPCTVFLPWSCLVCAFHPLRFLAVWFYAWAVACVSCEVCVYSKRVAVFANYEGVGCKQHTHIKTRRMCDKLREFIYDRCCVHNKQVAVFTHDEVKLNTLNHGLEVVFVERTRQ